MLEQLKREISSKIYVSIFRFDIVLDFRIGYRQKWIKDYVNVVKILYFKICQPEALPFNINPFVFVVI